MSRATSDARWARYVAWFRAVTAWHARFVAQRACGHHWHAQGFHDWRCCRCDADRDGWPAPDRADCLKPGTP